MERSPRAVAQELRMWRQAGVERILLATKRTALSSATPPTSDVQTAQRVSTAITETHSPVTTSPSLHDKDGLNVDERKRALHVIAQEVCACTRCPELVRNRTQTVFGTGNVAPRLCFFGEAPGADEDRLGEPFVGRSGQLLNKIMEACTLKRDDVYILNVLKCRPPNNRTPSAEEMETCRPFYERQLEILRPEFICCLGSVAATALLQTKSPLGKLRGRFHAWKESQVVVTYHPSYLLRNPAAKRDTWDDMKMLMQAMGIALP